jgi:hypothetical protein
LLHGPLGWVNEDGLHVVEVEIAEAEGHDGREGGDGDSHLVGHLLAAAALPFLLGDHDLDGVAQLLLFRLGQEPVVADAGAEDRVPAVGKRRAQDLTAAAIFQPGEQHNLLKRKETVAMSPRSFYTGGR